MTVPLAWLGELGAGKFAQGVAGLLPPIWGTRTLPPPCPQPPAPAMTDPSACKTTIALISGGGRAASGHPGLQAPSSSWVSLHQGQGSHGGGGGEVRGQRSPVSHDEVGVFFTSGGQGVRGILQSSPPPVSHCGHLKASASLPSRSPHCLGPYLSSSPRAQAGRLETQGMAPT